MHGKLEMTIGAITRASVQMQCWESLEPQQASRSAYAQSKMAAIVDATTGIGERACRRSHGGAVVMFINNMFCVSEPWRKQGRGSLRIRSCRNHRKTRPMRVASCQGRLRGWAPVCCEGV